MPLPSGEARLAAVEFLDDIEIQREQRAVAVAVQRRLRCGVPES